MPYSLYKDVEQVEEWIKTLVDEENNFAFYEKDIDKVIGTGSETFDATFMEMHLD